VRDKLSMKKGKVTGDISIGGGVRIQSHVLKHRRFKPNQTKRG